MSEIADRYRKQAQDDTLHLIEIIEKMTHRRTHEQLTSEENEKIDREIEILKGALIVTCYNMIEGSFSNLLVGLVVSYNKEKTPFSGLNDQRKLFIAQKHDLIKLSSNLKGKGVVTKENLYKQFFKIESSNLTLTDTEKHHPIDPDKKKIKKMFDISGNINEKKIEDTFNKIGINFQYDIFKDFYKSKSIRYHSTTHMKDSPLDFIKKTRNKLAHGSEHFSSVISITQIDTVKLAEISKIAIDYMKMSNKATEDFINGIGWTKKHKKMVSS